MVTSNWLFAVIAFWVDGSLIVGVEALSVYVNDLAVELLHRGVGVSYKALKVFLTVYYRVMVAVSCRLKQTPRAFWCVIGWMSDWLLEGKL